MKISLPPQMNISDQLKNDPIPDELHPPPNVYYFIKWTP